MNSHQSRHRKPFAVCSLLLLSGLLMAGSCQPRYTLDPYIALVIDDFEDVTRSYWKNEDQFMYSRLDYTSDARVGSQAGVFTMAGDKGDYRWVELYRHIDRWPEGGEAITFWAKAKEPIEVYVKLNEKGREADMEQWGAKVHLTTTWQWHKIPLSAFTTRLIAGPKANHQLDLFAVYGIGFSDAAPYWPVEFTVDQLQIERRHVTR